MNVLQILLTSLTKSPRGVMLAQMIGAIERYFARLARVAPSLCQSLRPGASPSARRALEQTIGFTLPEPVHRLLALADGQTEPDYSIGVAYGLPLLSCAQITEEWLGQAEGRATLRELLDEFQFVVAPGSIQPRYSVAGWVPLFGPLLLSDWMGVDLEPGPIGSVGQVINFGRDQEQKYVAAVDLDSWFGLLDEWLVIESADVTSAKVEEHVATLFALEPLALNRCADLAHGRPIKLWSPTLEEHGAIPDSLIDASERLLAAAREELAELDRHAYDDYRGFSQAMLTSRAPDRTSLLFRTRATHRWVGFEANPVTERARELLDLAAKHNLPQHIDVRFDRADSGWIETIRAMGT